MTDPTKRHACMRCRASKLRCLVDTFGAHGKCRRCVQSGTECVFESVAPRQRRKRTDTRVAALEKQIDGLKAALVQGQQQQHHDEHHHQQQQQQQQQDSRRDGGNSASSPTGQQQADSGMPSRKRQSHTAADGDGHVGHDDALTASSDHTTTTNRTGNVDAIPGLLGPNTVSIHRARTLFHEFQTSILPEYPVLQLSPADDFDALRTSQPTLLLAAVSAAAHASDPVLFRDLHQRLISHLADQVLVRGRRTVELVQAMVVMHVWDDPPDDMDHLSYYIWVQIGGTMVRQLGLWSWSEEADEPQAGLQELHQHQHEHSVGESKMADWRTAFAVYISVSSVAVNLRRPNSFPWTPRMRRTLQLFDQHSTHLHDKRIIAWVRLQMLAEDVESCRINLLKEQRQHTEAVDSVRNMDQSIVASLEEQFGDWREASQPVLNDSLLLHYFYYRIKLYEVAIYVSQTQGSHNGTLHSLRDDSSSQALRQHENGGDVCYVRHVMSLVKSVHQLVDIIIHQDVRTFRQSPIVNTVRLIYAMHELHLIWKAARDQQTYLGGFVDDQMLELKLYTRQARNFFERARGSEDFAIPKMGYEWLEPIAHDVATPAAERAKAQQAAGDEADAAHGPGGATGKSLNDMDALLPADVTRSEPSVSSSTPGTVAGWLSATGVNTSQPQPQPPSPTLMGTYEAIATGYPPMPALSELDMMAMPNAVMDPNWLFNETGAFYPRQMVE